MDQASLDESITGLMRELDGVITGRFSAAVYGSVARGDWIPHRSDVNLLVVLDDPSPSGLQVLMPALAAWHKRGLTPPLFIGREEWRAASDVFPIEITDMRLAYRVLHGADPIEGMIVEPVDLRRALETELRGKLVRLRQAYVRFGDTTPMLGGFATSSVVSLLVLLRAIAVLLGREPGREPRDTVAALAAELGPEGDSIVEIAAHRRDKEWKCPPGVFARYLEVVRRAVDIVDTHHQHGAR